MAPTLAFAGKGGVGKTTLAGTLARLIARQDHRVVAVDGDLNPNLAISLGLNPSQAAALRGVPSSIAGFVTLPTGQHRLILKKSFEVILEEYGAGAPDGVQLLMMGRPDHAGSG